MIDAQAFLRMPGTHPPSADTWLIQLLRGGQVTEAQQSTVAWPKLVQAAYRHGLAPALFVRLRDGEQFARLPVGVRSALENAYCRTLAVNSGVLAELSRLLEHFQHAGIPVVLLKGAALLQSLYPDQGQRPLGDIDLLIPGDSVKAASAILADAGYGALPELHPGFGRRYHVEQTWLRRQPPHQQIDLHWHLFGRPYYRRRASIDWFWAQSRCLPQDQLPARIFSSEAQLLHLAAHAMLHHRGSRLVWSYDLVYMLTEQTPMWPVVCSAAKQFGLLPALCAAVSLVQNGWGVAVPSFPTDLQTRWVERAYYAAITSRHSTSRMLLDGLSLGSVRAACGMWGCLLFPDQAYMLGRYKPVDKRLLPLLYAYRAGSGLARTVLATGRTLLEVPWKPS